MYTFKVGDRVKIVRDDGSNYSGLLIGSEFVVEEIFLGWLRKTKGEPTGVESFLCELVTENTMNCKKECGEFPARAGTKVRARISCSGTVKGEIYTVEGYSGGERIVNCICNNSTYWEIIEEVKTKKTFMSKVSTMMKKLLDADTQTLVKANYIDGDLMLTPEGTTALLAELFTSNKAALVTSAQAKLDEEKADK